MDKFTFILIAKELNTCIALIDFITFILQGGLVTICESKLPTPPYRIPLSDFMCATHSTHVRVAKANQLFSSGERKVK